MKKIKIISDSACDLYDSLLKDNCIDTVPFYITINGGEFLKEYIDIDTEQFYTRMVEDENVVLKTSLPTVQDYLDAFLKNKENDIICICISSTLSGSVNSARMAKDLFLEQYPDANIAVFDSGMATGLQGLFLLEIGKMLNDDLNFEEVVEEILKIQQTGRIIYTVKDISYLRRGGRIGKVAAIISKAIKIKPIIMMQHGEIGLDGIGMGYIRTKNKIVDTVKKFFEKNEIDPKDYVFSIGYGFEQEESVKFKESFMNTFENGSELLAKEYPIFKIGATVGLHNGPFTIGIAFIKKYQKKNN